MGILNVLELEVLRSLKRFPRCPENRELLVNMRTLDRESSLIIFISHCWLQGGQDADGHPYPDDSAGNKYKLCMEGVDKIRSKREGVTVYVWFDYSCLDQSRDPATQLSKYDLDVLFEWTDCLFTPLVESYNKHATLDTGDGFHTEYQDVYLSRAWCRMEVLFAACIPLTHPTQLDKFETVRFIRNASLSGKRIHFMYGTRESLSGQMPVCLPPVLTPRLFVLQHPPAQGALSVASDRGVLETLTEHLRATAMRAPESPPHIMPNGDVYDGDWSAVLDCPHGFGRLSGARGVYEGQFEEGQFCGTGCFKYEGGDEYTGNFAHGQRHGRGRFTRTSVCEVYEGEWREDAPHGRGRFIGRDGVVFDADSPINAHGHCSIRWPNGDVYAGEYKDMMMHGEGRFTFADGRIMSGFFVRGKFVGNRRPRGEHKCCVS